MTNQEIFEMLSEAESHMFEAMMRNSDNQDLIHAVAYLRCSLTAFAKATGCHN